MTESAEQWAFYTITGFHPRPNVAPIDVEYWREFSDEDLATEIDHQVSKWSDFASVDTLKVVAALKRFKQLGQRAYQPDMMILWDSLGVTESGAS